MQNQGEDLIKPILCFEGHCLIIESINLNTFYRIIKRINSDIIDLNSALKDSDEIKQEVVSFGKHFNIEIKMNDFVKLTIQPISAYIIRRYFYPSNFFMNQSFFSFKKNQQQKSTDFIKFDLQKMTTKVENDKKEFDVAYLIDEFKENDFIYLRSINQNSYASFNLVIHIKTFMFSC